MQQQNKTLIIDNLTGRPDLVDFVLDAKKSFANIVITLSSTVYFAYFRDESRLADFEELKIGLLTQAQQESLIRKRLALANRGDDLTDGYVDRVEQRVNGIVIADHIVPRYPFFVLCILQTYEAYMPAGMAITSYGHCYYALIVASLVRAGISQRESDIDACFNFAEHLAAEIHGHGGLQASEDFDFDAFVSRYRRDFLIRTAMITRLKDREFGLIGGDGCFRSDYMYYYFLGRRLAKGSDESREIVHRMCEATFVSANYLTLLFTIHHTADEEIIDEILLGTMLTVDDFEPAKLDRSETMRFESIVSHLPKSILSEESVAARRRRDRSALQEGEDQSTENSEADVDGDADAGDPRNAVYRVWKNNEIMGQVLRTKYGSITRSRLEEIIEIVCDAGMRLVGGMLSDEEAIDRLRLYFESMYPGYDRPKVEKMVRVSAFVWAIFNLEHVVQCINVPGITDSILHVTRRGDTPAFDLIGYFTLLDTADTLTRKERDELARVYKARTDSFVRELLSMRTQHYMNTHSSKASIEQSLCSVLQIKYVRRLIAD